MKYVNLGRSGLKVSRLCLGCMSYGEPERLPQPWSLDEKASRPLIRQALEAGINFFYRRIFYGSLALCKNAAYR
ncbi:oxidoreductase [Klebsiella pneumoniae]|nr:oxidoreductase [Klebsiella pneumoniae]